MSFVGLEENEEYLELAQAKSTAANAPLEFQLGQVDELTFDDDEFDVVIGDGSLVAPQRVPKMLAEMSRVVRPGGLVVLVLPTASSFGEFFSIYWEVLHNRGLEQAATSKALLLNFPQFLKLKSWLKMRDWKT